MKRRSYSITLAIVTVALILSAAVFSKAQNREKFVISAKAGGVNAISGRTEVRSKHGGEWQLLSITDNLKTGDLVKTGADGGLEMNRLDTASIELTPGATPRSRIRPRTSNRLFRRNTWSRFFWPRPGPPKRS